MSDLHGQIMNVVCRIQRDEQTSADAVLAYREGHRDARHAAAELALAQDARVRRLEEALEHIVRRLQMDIDDGGRKLPSHEYGQDQGPRRHRQGNRRAVMSISTLDSAQSRRELSAQFCEEDTSSVDWMVAEIDRCIAADITKEPLLFVPGTPTALKVIAQGLDYDDLAEQMAQLLIDVAAGHRMQGHASELLRMVVERFAQGVVS